jgi:hypothetical protein
LAEYTSETFGQNYLQSDTSQISSGNANERVKCNLISLLFSNGVALRASSAAAFLSVRWIHASCGGGSSLDNGLAFGGLTHVSLVGIYGLFATQYKVGRRLEGGIFRGLSSLDRQERTEIHKFDKYNVDGRTDASKKY